MALAHPAHGAGERACIRTRGSAPRDGDRAHERRGGQAGHGAARECCDLLLTAAGRYADLLRGHLVTLDGGR